MLLAAWPQGAPQFNVSSCAPAHNAPLPLRRSPPVSCKHMSGRTSLLTATGRVASKRSPHLPQDSAHMSSRYRRPSAASTCQAVRPSSQLLDASPAKGHLTYRRTRHICRVAIVAPILGEVDLATSVTPLADATIPVWPIGIERREIRPARPPVVGPVQVRRLRAIETQRRSDDDSASMLWLGIRQYRRGRIGRANGRTPSGPPKDRDAVANGRCPTLRRRRR